MDALGVSICKGINNKKINIKKSIIVGLYFGISQGIMPIIGYFLGNIFNNKMVIFTAIGYIFGNIIGYKYQKKSQIIGGLALIILGLKFLIEVLF